MGRGKRNKIAVFKPPLKHRAGSQYGFKKGLLRAPADFLHSRNDGFDATELRLGVVCIFMAIESGLIKENGDGGRLFLLAVVGFERLPTTFVPWRLLSVWRQMTSKKLFLIFSDMDE